MRTRFVLLLFTLIGAGAAQAAQPPAENSVVSLGAVGAGVVLGPGPIAQGQLTAEFKDGVVMALSARRERSRVGLELRLLIPTRELEVTNESGDLFPHHASHPLLWSAGVVAFPLPPLGIGLHRRVRLLASAGAGGMLVTADLDNAGGQSVYHPWLWTVGAGLRFDLGPVDGGKARSIIELRIDRATLGSAGPFEPGRVTAITLALGLGL